MSNLERAQRRKNSAALPWLHVCDCGERAAQRRCGSWVCATCLKLERAYYGTNCVGKKLSVPHHNV